MVVSGADKVRQQRQEELARIAEISMTVRQAVRNALPAPPEQFFTMMVPGKVIDFEDFVDGYDAKGKSTSPLTTRSVQLAEAKLCDDMPALSAVQLGPTGRSVARSYSSTLTKLCPTGHTVGVDDGVANANFGAAEKRYQNAMEWLTSPASPTSSDTRIDRYRDKQNRYTEAFERKIKAFDDALARAMKDPANNTVARQRDAYDKWIAENQKTYINNLQAAYMDWVTLGKKEEVEYYFAIVDNDSAMARVEASKEAMRNAIISDTDGSTEFNTVSLTPSNWAWIAQKKASDGPKGETAESLTWKISRLEKINLILSAMIAHPESVNGSTPPAAKAAPDNTKAPTGEFLKAMQDYQNANIAYEKAKKAHPDTEPDKTDLDAKANAMNSSRDKLTDYFAQVDQSNIDKLNTAALSAQATLFENHCKSLQQQVAVNEKQISAYQAQLNSLLKPKDTTAAAAVQDTFAISAGIPPAVPDPSPIAANDTNYWTSISVEVSSSYAAQQSSSSSNSFSVGGSVSWGLFSVGGSAAHSDATADFAKQMANSNVKASFDCMRVDISRSWLRGELFYDDDLMAAAGNFISPGPITLAGLMDPDTYEVTPEVAKLDRQKELARYDLFPMYPTSFLLAANVVLEIEGDTSDIQTHFHTSSTSGSASVGWGPFAISSSFSHTDTQANSTCEATATGCKITIRSPQIIGWISQIVPALPRLPA